MEEFEMTPAVVIETGEEMKGLASKIVNDLNEITARINMIPDKFKGQSSDMIMEKYSLLSTKFKDFIDKANECSKYLIDSANLSLEADKALQEKMEENF